ncbi:MAG: glycoside hydrolase family 16 protein [Cyclobacteriaceae bacterium]|nr:glycoside hydrolase family 16 protein [Cyclobacteriaceae bacterium]MCX7637660.1 glycoside hydrolase family 16 protein [Cyclobacteriaceae bacterium]
MVKKWKLFTLLILLLAGCSGRSNEHLIWSDEFSSSGLPDTTKWNYDLGDGCPNLCGWGNNEAQFYTRRLGNARVENGMLVIEAHHHPDSTVPYTSARLVTRGKAQWKYARIEVRARLPKGRGTWPAIWMLPSDWKYGGWPASGEIDIMEHVGFDEGVIHGTVHTETYNHIKKTQREGIVRVDGVTSDFHVYAVEWSENTIAFSVDGKTYYSVNRSSTDTWKEWPFDQPFYLILNIAVGGFWGGMQGIDDSIWPQRMEVDYVRVYKR